MAYKIRERHALPRKMGEGDGEYPSDVLFYFILCYSFVYFFKTRGKRNYLILIYICLVMHNCTTIQATMS